MEVFKKNMIAIFSALSILTLFLPLASISTEVESEYISTSTSVSVSGFQAATGSLFGFVLLLGPALLIAMNYIKQVERYRGLISLAVPVVCLVMLIVCYLQADSFSASASNEYASADVSVSMGLGLIATAIAYLATAVAGAITFYGLKLNKDLGKQLKNVGAAVAGDAKDAVPNKDNKG